MIKKGIIKQISLCLAITLIICSMSAFVADKNAKADEIETTTAEQETTTQPTNPDEYEMVAHRGFSDVAPENSKYAFEKAIEAGFKHIELDLQRCKENDEGVAEYVITHDEDLQRLCGVNKKISENTVEEIQKYPYITGNNLSHFKNVKILSLTELIDIIVQNKDKGIDWRFEIKELDNDDQKDKLYDEIVQPLIDADVIDNVTFISFYSSNIRKILKKNDSIKAWYLAKVLDEEHWGYAKSLRDSFGSQVEGVIVRGTTYTTDETDVQTALDYGFKVGVYVLDSSVMMGAYYRMGIRSFTTNKIVPGAMSVSKMKNQYSMKDFDYVISKRSYSFTNTRKKPTLTISYEGEELLEGLCYEISYSDNRYPGTGSVIATGVRNCGGEKEKTFTIDMPKVKGFHFVKNTPTTLTYQWNFNEYAKGYKVYKYNYKTKKYKLVKTIKNNTTTTFKAKKLKTATKYRYRVKTYFATSTKTYYSDPCNGKTAYTKPGAEKKIKMKRSKEGKTMTIVYGKVPRATGYIIKYANNKKLTKNVRICYSKANAVFFNNLIKKKPYYAKVRAYLKVGKKVYYGKYSKIVKKKGVKPKKKKKKKKKKKNKKK